jgi:hypothetical protein
VPYRAGRGWQLEDEGHNQYYARLCWCCYWARRRACRGNPERIGRSCSCLQGRFTNWYVIRTCWCVVKAVVRSCNVSQRSDVFVSCYRWLCSFLPLQHTSTVLHDILRSMRVSDSVGYLLKEFRALISSARCPSCSRLRQRSLASSLTTLENGARIRTGDPALPFPCSPTWPA